MTTTFEAGSKAGERITELDVDLVDADERRWLDDPDGEDDWRDEVAACCGGRDWRCGHFGQVA
jgi:hypothetical protein